MLFLSFLSGVALFYSFNYFPFFTISIGILSSACLIIRKKASLILIILLGIAFSFLRFEQEKDISHIAGREVIATGTFQSYPVETESGNFKQPFDIISAIDKESGERYRELVGKKDTILADRGLHSGSEYKILIQIFREKIRHNPGSLDSDEINARLLEEIEPVNNSSLRAKKRTTVASARARRSFEWAGNRLAANCLGKCPFRDRPHRRAVSRA